MKRRLLGLLVGLSLVVMGLGATSISAAASADSATTITCTTTTYHYGPWVWDGGTYVRSWLEVVPYLNGGCYYTFIYGAQASDGEWVYASLVARVWVCGNFYNGWVPPYGQGGSQTFSTGRIWYGTCGPQADNHAYNATSWYWTQYQSQVTSYVNF